MAKRTFLGAFGNKCFLKAQYELTEDGLTLIEGGERYSLFPNGGTVYYPEGDEEGILTDRLIKFEVDFKYDISQRFDMYNQNSNKYEARSNNIVPLDEDEIIEVIELDFAIEDFLDNKSNRIIPVNHKPNRQVLLHMDEYCYGPFEFNLEYDVNKKTYIKIIIEDEIIKKYLYKDIERYENYGYFSLKSKNEMKFIYNLSKLDGIPYETIEYVDEDKLMELLKKILEYSYSMDEVAKLSKDFARVVKEFGDPKELDVNEYHIKKLVQLLDNVKELKAYKNKIIDDYFKYNINSDRDKRAYLDEHIEIIEELAKSDLNYEELKIEYESEISNLVLEKERQEKELEDQKSNFEEYHNKVVEEKKSELEILEQEKKKEFDFLEEKKKDISQEIQAFEINRDKLKNVVEAMKVEKFEIENNIEKKISDWAAQNRNTEMVNLLFSELNQYSKAKENSINYEKSVVDDMSAQDILTLVQNRLVASGRNYTDDEVYNYIISIVQNYITVFAGEPGSGKTSLCRILAKSMGVYTDRYAEVKVERGWMSSKDLVGYYNPLTKEIEASQPEFTRCMRTLSTEREMGRQKLPYFVLLDEANLSPIEFYWSNFNYYSDSPEKQTITYANGEEYVFGQELKFLATINYDHTTEVLSPRFLDRAWVILMKSDVNIDEILSFAQSKSDENDIVADNDKVISYDNLERLFGKNRVIGKKMNPVIKERLKTVIDLMIKNGHSISIRSIKAVCNYYMVAEEYMSSKEVALDFAIAQKFLPMISGNGQDYRKFLDELFPVCNDNQMGHCADIIKKIIARGEHEFYGYFNA